MEAELQKLENDNIIEPVTGATPWISPIVTPPKPKDPDKVRICVDIRQANTAIQRERHVTPTSDDVLQELNGTKDSQNLISELVTISWNFTQTADTLLHSPYIWDLGDTNA